MNFLSEQRKIKYPSRTCHNTRAMESSIHYSLLLRWMRALL